MKKQEYKKQLLELLEEDVEGLSHIDKLALVRSTVLELEKEVRWDESNKGKSWTDEELQVVFTFAPTKENCIKLAKAFNRGYGSIEQIFRWAATTDKLIANSERKDDKFINQVKRVAKEAGWRV